MILKIKLKASRKSSERNKVIKGQKSFVRINHQIYSPFVRVTQDGNNLGILPVDQAQDIADQSGLDLVEVVPNANPPVCTIMDFGKYRFEQKKKVKEQHQKSKAIAPKAIRLRPVSNDHDVETKINQLKKFLAERRTVVVNIIFKKRELMFKDQGIKIMEKVVAAVEGVAKVESHPRLEGKILSVRLQPK